MIMDSDLMRFMRMMDSDMIVTTYATLYSQRRFSRRLSGNRLSNQAELSMKVLDFSRV